MRHTLLLKSLCLMPNFQMLLCLGKSLPHGHSSLPMYFQKLPDRISEETAMLYCKSLLSEFTNVHDVRKYDVKSKTMGVTLYYVLSGILRYLLFCEFV